MTEIKKSYYPGWVHEKDDLEITANFAEVLKFYIFGTPCIATSSSGKSMQKRKWKKDVWKSQDLRSFLLSKAELQNGITYSKADKLDKMSECATAIGLSGSFQKVRDKNRIVFYSNNKDVDMLTIFYYIRCALAHGRFQIYDNNNNERIYVLEAIKANKRSSKDYYVKARMVLKESTLLLWARTIAEGPIKFAETKRDNEAQIQKDIKKVISSNPSYTRQQIVDEINCKSKTTGKQFDLLRDSNEIKYSQTKKQWECIS